MERSHVVCGAAGATAALLLAGLVAAQTRQTPPTSSGAYPTVPDPLVPRQAATSPVPFSDAPSPRPAAQPRERGIDELVVTLERIKLRKAELDLAEKETVAILKEKLRQQKRRLQKLGIADESAQPTPVPPVCMVPGQPNVSWTSPGAAPPASLAPNPPAMPRVDIGPETSGN